MEENLQVNNLPTCAGCCQPFSWDNAYHHQDTPGSAPYNPPGHGIFRPRVYCPNCGALVAEWHINQVKDYDEWAWYGDNAALNASRPLPPSPLYLWGKGIPVQSLPKFEEHRLALDGSGKRIAFLTGVPDAVTTPSTDGVLVGHTEGISSCAVSPDGAWIVSNAGGYPEPGDLKVWKVANGSCLHTFARQTTPVRNPLAVGPDSTWFVSTGGSIAAKEFVLRIWDIATGSCQHTLTGHTNWVGDCAIAPDGTWLVSASNDHSLRIWDVATGTCRKILVGHRGCVYRCRVSPDGTWIVSTGNDGTLRVWDVATGACRHILVGHTDGDIKTGFAEVHACAVSPDGTWVVSGGGDGTLRIWDVATGTCRHLLVGHTDAVFYVSVSPDGEWIASGSNPVIHGKDLDLRIWDSRTGACLHVLHGHTGWVNDVAVSPDGRWIVSASRDTTLRIWDPHTGACIRSLIGHEGGVARAAVSPDSTWIISAGYDQTLRIWDLETGTCRLPLSRRGGTEPVLPAPWTLDQPPLVAGVTAPIPESLVGVTTSPTGAPPTEQVPAKPSIKSLVERGDVHGLIDRLHHPEPSQPKEYPASMAPGLRALYEGLDQKIGRFGEERNAATLGLQALGERAVPALIEELGTKDLEAHAAVELALARIGAPALPALAAVIRSGPEDHVLAAGVTIGEMRKEGVRLPDDIVAALVAVKTGGANTVTSRTAAAHALGPLDRRSIIYEIGGKQVVAWALTEDVTRAKAIIEPAEQTPEMQICKRCGRSIKTSDCTCPYCGYTQWERIVGTGIFYLLCLGAAIFGGSHIAASWLRPIVMWGGGIVMAIGLLQTISLVIGGLQTPRKPLPESTVVGMTAPAPGSATGATLSPAECAKCGVQRDAQDVRIYYGTKRGQSQIKTEHDNTITTYTTTSYTVGGWDNVSICDHCTKVRSFWRFFNVLWSVPLGLGCAWIFVSFVVELFSGGIHGGFNSYYVVFLFFCGLFGIVKTVDYVICLVKPINETSQSAVARKVVANRHAGRYDTFWTQAELEKLKLS